MIYVVLPYLYTWSSFDVGGWELYSKGWYTMMTTFWQFMIQSFKSASLHKSQCGTKKQLYVFSAGCMYKIKFSVSRCYNDISSYNNLGM